MKKYALFALIIFGLGGSAISQTKLSQYVNPFIGTGGHGHTYPGPAMPFGMIQPGPDTRLEGWDGSSGYHYTDSVVYGFSQTHLSGTGISDDGDFLIMPTTGAINFLNTAYASEFNKKNEQASPGYYSTTLDKYQIKAEITTTRRAALYRFTYPSNTDGNLIIDLKHRDKVLDSWIEVVNDREIKGYRRSSAWSKDQQLYFHLTFNKPFKTSSVALDDQIIVAAGRRQGKNVKMALTFAKSNEPLLAKISISAVDEEGALKNLTTEMPGFAFATVKATGERKWDEALSKIKAKSTDKTKLMVFYSALYHALLNPNLFMDVDHRYRGLDKSIHTAKGFEYYSVFSLWDTYRTENPLLALIEPKKTLDFIQTFLAMYKQGGLLPIWPLGEDETFCMIGNHAIPVIVDAYAKGIRGFDVELALEAMKHSVNRKQFGIDHYAVLGAVMADKEHESASKTVEYAYDDWCIAQFAKMLGKTNDYNTYIRRAQNWKNVFDVSSGHIRARNNGGWWTPFDPAEVNNNYTEGNSWHYSFSTQQDINTHMAMMGGEKAYESKLNELFTTNQGLTGRDQSDITGLIGQYAHGNEPSHHMAYLFNFTNHPEKTQFYVNKIMDEQYHNRPDGLSGNEDCGQMSAWLVMSAMGFYPVSPGNNMYIIGTPWMDEINLTLPSGKNLIVNAKNRSNSNIYWNALMLGGQPWKKSFINFEDFKNGGKLDFTMSSTPATKYLNSLSKPIMEIKDQLIVPNPAIEGPAETFKGDVTISISNAANNTETYYTLDGTLPTKKSLKYIAPFSINNTATVKAISFKNGFIPSYVTTAVYKLIDNKYTIKVFTEINKSYTGGGNDALIDGVRGALNWRVGNRWQGFWGKDFEAIIDLGKVTSINTVQIGAIQDTNAWIVFPPTTTFYISETNDNFRQVAVVNAPMAANDYTIAIKEIKASIGATARYIKIVAKNYGVLPTWHEGAGGLAHLFFDEIQIK